MNDQWKGFLLDQLVIVQKRLYFLFTLLQFHHIILGFQSLDLALVSFHPGFLLRLGLLVHSDLLLPEVPLVAQVGNASAEAAQAMTASVRSNTGTLESFICGSGFLLCTSLEVGLLLSEAAVVTQVFPPHLRRLV